MADILAHPWLQGATPGIIYVPAPPVSELAQPLPSALHIDRDLFESLCVIWGRHADPNVIRADLLSPAGQGTLAKAFYFLLQKHREKTMEENGILMDIDEVFNAVGKIITKQYAAPRSKRPTHPELQDLNRPPLPQVQFLNSGRNAPAPPVRSSSPMTLTINTDMLIERPPSRAHPPSPVGPRPQKPRPVSAFVTTPRPSQDPPQFFSPNLQARPMFPTLQRVQTDSAASPGQGHSQSAFAQLQARELPPPPVRRGSAPPPIGWAGLSPGVPRSNYRASMAAPSPVIHAPMPVQAPATPMLPMITAPKVPDVKLQQTFDQYADMVNLQAASWNASHVDRPTGSAREPLDDRMDITEDRVASGTGRAGPCEAMDTASRTSVMNDKENCAVNGTSPKAHRHDNAHNAGGLGFGHSVPMAKEMGNLVFFNEPAHKDQHKDKKDRRSRRES